MACSFSTILKLDTKTIKECPIFIKDALFFNMYLSLIFYDGSCHSGGVGLKAKALE